MRGAGMQERGRVAVHPPKRAASVSCLSAGLRVCSQHSAKLEKEEESVQNPCRSVKEGGLWTGTQRGGECGGYSTHRIWGATAHLLTRLYTFCRAEQT